MWQLGVGPMEILLLLLVGISLVLTRGGRRWIVGILPCFVVGALATPADPASMLIVALPLVVAFVAGVRMSSFLRLSKGDNNSAI